MLFLLAFACDSKAALTSHIRNARSCPPETINGAFFLGANATEVTALTCPLPNAMHSFLPTFHKRTIWSFDPVAAKLTATSSSLSFTILLGAQSTDKIASKCPANAAVHVKPASLSLCAWKIRSKGDDDVAAHNNSGGGNVSLFAFASFNGFRFLIFSSSSSSLPLFLSSSGSL